jgi:hypothetical protein
MMLNVMPGLVPGIHVFLSLKQEVDGRDTPGHDKNKTRGVGFRQAFPFRTHIAGIFAGISNPYSPLDKIYFALTNR